MGGIIVIDFIDMDQMRNRKKLIKALYDALKADRAKTTVSEINELGMIEMTRKRVKHNLVKALSQPCPYCEGSGQVRSVTTMTFDTLRKLQSLFVTSKEKHIVLQVHPDVPQAATGKQGHADEIAERFGRDQRRVRLHFHIHDTKVLRARNLDEITAHLIDRGRLGARQAHLIPAVEHGRNLSRIGITNQRK